ncbi:hypothetical protein [Actinophytocola glycyrrhizae]|uniref:Uncharacterized protein n=1 Tax=Actinophytocola glycyrrhizae TaxID=2044873 RepID=A0ABV9RU39_9PSEU
MRIKPIALVALVAAALTVLPTATAYASCSMAAGKVDSVTRVLEEELVRAAPLRPGSDARDVVWLKKNIPAMVPDWLAETKGVVAAAKPEIDRVVDDCYRPGDYSVPGPVRFDFIDCAKKGALTQVTSFSPAEWGVVCDEVRAALDDPAVEDKIRAWARTWIDAYIKYAQNRPAA